ncbi:MAG: hypothetical protein H6660_07940 [Ardenticatenaceae bacterium]|nr:hypothetical protein [Ardenticatenaceae bacterium]
MQQKVVHTHSTPPQRRWSGSAGGGALLVLGGLLFLWIRLSGAWANWWSVFILIAALALWGVAWGVGRYENGRSHFIARSNAALGFIIFTVAIMFLFDMDWSIWWPLMILTPGLGLLGISWRPTTDSPSCKSWQAWGAGSVRLC